MLGVSGKYRLDTRLGGGGMAEVFIGSMVGAEGFSRKVAIKRVLPGFSDNPAFSGMFIAEAQISSRLVHPNIVSVLDFDRDAENRLFLVMELVEGRDLDALISSGPIPIPIVIFLIGEVLRGLGYAHDLPIGSEMRGVIHRDVSPHNVLLSWEGAVKVSDFGIAKARSASNATASVFIKGKPAYMSPEQANGQALDGRSDLFAVGIMLWEMLVGRRLFIADDTRATLAAVLFGQVPRPRTIRGDIPKDLERVVMKLLERDLPARYATAEHAIADLMNCADAPKSGRDDLIELLAERFPNDAQIRQSIMRSRSGKTPRGLPGPALAQTLPAGSPAHAHSLGAAMSAPTGTLQTQRSGKRGLKIALLGVATAVTAAVTFGVIASVLDGKREASPDAAIIASAEVPAVPTDAAVAADAPAPVPPPPPDAPPPPADAPIDAPSAPRDAPSRTPKKDASANQPAQPVEKKYGRLDVTAFPVLTVTLDGKLIGDTQVNTQVPIGKHSLLLTNSEGYKERLTIEIKENETTSIKRMNQ